MKTLSREEALRKWNSLDEKTKKKLAKKYKPNWTFEMVNNSSSTIQRILNLDCN
jgi:hypothetical protein